MKGSEICIQELQAHAPLHRNEKVQGRKLPITFRAENGQILIDVNSCDNSTDKQAIITSALSEASGSSDTFFALTLVQQYSSVLAGGEGIEKAIEVSNSFMNNMVALKPQDEIEAMLLTQILSLQSLGMKCAVRAGNAENSIVNVDRNVNNLTKLLRLQHETIETLNRYKRKGTQKVVVQHVNVNEGGRAIVGGVIEGGGI